MFMTYISLYGNPNIIDMLSCWLGLPSEAVVAIRVNAVHGDNRLMRLYLWISGTCYLLATIGLVTALYIQAISMWQITFQYIRTAHEVFVLGHMDVSKGSCLHEVCEVRRSRVKQYHSIQLVRYRLLCGLYGFRRLSYLFKFYHCYAWFIWLSGSSSRRHSVFLLFVLALLTTQPEHSVECTMRLYCGKASEFLVSLKLD